MITFSSVGTWTWAERTNGRLGRRDRLELVRQGVLARLAHDPRPDRAQAVAEAISLHLNISVPPRLGAEASLLSKGVMLDVVGRRLEQLPRRAVDQVVEHWPRAGSKDSLLAATKRQAEVRPHSRAGLLHRLGFAQLVATNPLDRAVAFPRRSAS